MPKEKTDYEWHGYLIDLQADKKGFVKCKKCGKKVKKELSHYYHPDCYCSKCWKPIDKQHKEEVARVFGGL